MYALMEQDETFAIVFINETLSQGLKASETKITDFHVRNTIKYNIGDCEVACRKNKCIGVGKMFYANARFYQITEEEREQMLQEERVLKVIVKEGKYQMSL